MASSAAIPLAKANPNARPLEQGQVGLEAGPAGVARPGVLEAAVHAHGVLCEGRGQVDRRVDGAGGRVGAAAAVDGAGLEPGPGQVPSVASSVSARARPPRWRARPSA